MSGKLTVEVFHCKSLKQIVALELDSGSTILDVKRAISAQS